MNSSLFLCLPFSSDHFNNSGEVKRVKRNKTGMSVSNIYKETCTKIKFFCTLLLFKIISMPFKTKISFIL